MKSSKRSKKAKSKRAAHLNEHSPKAGATPFYTPGFWKKHWWKGLILLLLPMVMYYQTYRFGYVLDDVIVIEENNFTTQGISGIDDLLTTESMTGYFGENKNLVQGNRYRPLSLVTFAMEYEFFGGKRPGPSHFINVLLYALTGLLIFRLFSMLLREKKTGFWWLSIAFLASLFFVTHPIHVEAVANIKGRDEILALLLSLGALYYALRYSDTQKLWALTSMGVVFFLALLAKENSITFLAVIPLTIYFFSDDQIKKLGKVALFLLGVTIVYLILRFSVAGVPDFSKEIKDLMNNPFYGMTYGEKLATIMYTLYKYISLFIFPHPLNHDYYPYAIPKLNWGDFRALGSLFLYLGIFIWGLVGFKKKSIPGYAILYYLTTLTIVSNIVVNLGTFMNERFLYMPSVGLCLLLAYFIGQKIGQSSQKSALLASVLSGLILMGYIYKTMDRVPAWENALTLNQSAVRYGTNSARSNSFMATALYEKARDMTLGDKKPILIDAYKYAEKAIKIHPTYQNANLMKAGIAAELYKIDRDEKKLLSRFAEVMSKRPDVSYLNTYLEYLEQRTEDKDYLVDWYIKTALNNILRQAKLPNWALHFLNRANKLDPNNPKVLDAISKVYATIGDRPKAKAFKQKAQLVQ